jgi:lysine 2,3-aminomutase
MIQPILSGCIETNSTNETQYYVHQGEMVPGAEDLRTPLKDSLHLERHIRGQIAGFLTPTFVVDMTGGGSKRQTFSIDSYDYRLGLAKVSAPSLKGGEDDHMDYWDPLWSVTEEAREEILTKFARQKTPST